MRPQKRREGTHEVLSKVVAQVGLKVAGDERLGVAEVAAFLSIAPGTLYKHLDPDQPGDLSYERVRFISEHFGVTGAAEDMARAAGGHFVPFVIASDPTKCVHEKISEGMKASAELHANAIMAASNGIYATEAKALLVDQERVEEASRRFRARLEEIVRMGDAGARSVRMVVGARS